jgi:hypothetical protein
MRRLVIAGMLAVGFASGCGGGTAANVGAVAQADEVRVTIESVRIGPHQRPHPTDSDAPPTKSKKDYLLVKLTIENLSDSKKLDYKTWGGSASAFVAGSPDDGNRKAIITDDLGNTYKRLNLGLNFRLIGQLSAESIFPGKSVTDLLVYERPVDKATHVNVELPPAAYGGDGTLKLRAKIER